MGVTVYPAVLDTTDGKKEWNAVVPMEGKDERLRADADTMDHGNPFEANPDYMPFSSIDISQGNLIEILRQIGIKLSPEAGNSIAIGLVFEGAHKALHVGRVFHAEPYVWERVFALREMARLGITRGATHIVWA